MTTPMSAYARVAKRYGVDPTDDREVDEFFLKVVPLLVADEREKILHELLRSRSGKSSRPRRSEPPRDIPLLPLEVSAVVPRRATESIDDRLNRIIRELIGSGLTLAQALEAFEGKYVVAAMNASRGNLTQASRRLGVQRNTLQNKLSQQTHGFVESVPSVRRRVSHKEMSARPSKKK